LVVVVLGIRTVQDALAAAPSAALAAIRDSYLSVRHHPEGLSDVQVFQGLAHSVNISNPRTWFALALLAASGVLIAAAWLGRTRSLVAEGALVALIMADLLAFGSSLHPSKPVQALVQETPAIRFLADAAVGRAA